MPAVPDQNAFIAAAFEEQFKEDGLTVMARGLGIRILIAKFLYYYCLPNSLKSKYPSRETSSKVTLTTENKPATSITSFSASSSNAMVSSAILPTFVPPSITTSHTQACVQDKSNVGQEETFRKLVFCINTNGIEEALLHTLMEWGLLPHELPKIISNEVSSGERVELFKEGGCFIITSRILIVDLLDGRIDPSHICGFLVPNAHTISDLSMESFIIRVYREKNRVGFLKAFTEDPESLITSFGKEQQILKLLYIKRLYLWPRFQILVDSVLSGRGPEVIELSHPLTRDMECIQRALLVAMSGCIGELKKSTPQLETSHLTIENGLFTSFDQIIRRQLEPEWHRLSAKTKQLSADLTNIRKLLDFLLRYDAFSFYSFLCSLRAASSNTTTQSSPSLWLGTEAADQIFKRARDRMYVITKNPLSSYGKDDRLVGSLVDDQRDSTGAATIIAGTSKPPFTEGIQSLLKVSHKLTPTLEVPPKWSMLNDVLNEIRQDIREKNEKRLKVVNDEKDNLNTNKKKKAKDTSGACADDGQLLRKRMKVKIGERGGTIKTGEKEDVGEYSSIQMSTDKKSLQAEETREREEAKGRGEEEEGNGIHSETSSEENLYLKNGRILIVVKDEKTAVQVKEVINHSKEQVIDQRYRWYISQRAAELRMKLLGSKTNSQGMVRGLVTKAGVNGDNQPTSIPAAMPTGAMMSKMMRSGQKEDRLGLGLSKQECESLPEETKLILLEEHRLRQTPIVTDGNREAFRYNRSREEMRDKNREIVVDEEGGSGQDIENDEDGEGEIGKIGHSKEFVIGRGKQEGGVLKGGSLSKTSKFSTTKIAGLGRNKYYKNVTDEIEGKERPTFDSDKAMEESFLSLLPPDSSQGSRSRSFHTLSHQSLNSSGGDDRVIANLPLNCASSQKQDLTSSLLEPFPHIIIMTHSQISSTWDLCREVEPSYVILYDPDVACVRNIEGYQTTCSTRIKVYFFFYAGSVEEHRYVGVLGKEKRAFEQLIQAKETMVISIPDLQTDLEREKRADMTITTDSRTLGRLKKDKGPRSVVVDLREFRSPLPSLLHASGLTILPRTLSVGDYVLAPEICIERKGISDLFQSFASGRLYNQAEAMNKYYQYPCLLIEFHPDKSFSLTSPGEYVSNEISVNSITTRLCVLAIAFPNLRYLWSRSPHATSGIFKRISQAHDEVDVEKACSVGGVSGLGGEDGQDIDARSTAIEMLLSLPGVNRQNFHSILDNVDCIADLSKMSEVNLTRLIGPVNAKKLRAFFSRRNMN